MVWYRSTRGQKESHSVGRNRKEKSVRNKGQQKNDRKTNGLTKKKRPGGNGAMLKSTESEGKERGKSGGRIWEVGEKMAVRSETGPGILRKPKGRALTPRSGRVTYWAGGGRKSFEGEPKGDEKPKDRHDSHVPGVALGGGL